MLSKLSTYGFTDSMINWVKHFITGRTQRVRIDGELSEAIEVISGIPQGTVLGPFLILVYVNDMPDLVRSMLYLFADDNKIWRSIEQTTPCISTNRIVNIKYLVLKG